MAMLPARFLRPSGTWPHRLLDDEMGLHTLPTGQVTLEADCRHGLCRYKKKVEGSLEKKTGNERETAGKSLCEQLVGAERKEKR